MTRIIWKGTTDEAMALLHALSANCECQVQDGRRTQLCASHRMLIREQRVIDWLLFMRHMAARLLAEEFNAPIVDWYPSEEPTLTGPS